MSPPRRGRTRQSGWRPSSPARGVAYLYARLQQVLVRLWRNHLAVAGPQPFLLAASDEDKAAGIDLADVTSIYTLNS
jgi:hypothetical protein